jgi:hypothetical protein
MLRFDLIPSQVRFAAVALLLVILDAGSSCISLDRSRLALQPAVEPPG